MTRLQTCVDKDGRQSAGGRRVPDGFGGLFDRLVGDLARDWMLRDDKVVRTGLRGGGRTFLQVVNLILELETVYPGFSLPARTHLVVYLQASPISCSAA